MKVTREVILDLLPVYLSGEASPATRALVEESMKQDADLAERIRLARSENFATGAPPALPPDLELRSFRRARALIGWQRWLFGFGIFFTSVALSLRISIGEGRPEEVHFLLFDHPGVLGILLALGLACWIAYFSIRRRLRAQL